MRDDPMEEIFTVATMNFEAGHRSFDFHSFPFRMTTANLRQHQGSPWLGFWTALKPGYEIFEKQKRVPAISVTNGNYVASLPQAGTPIGTQLSLGTVVSSQLDSQN